MPKAYTPMNVAKLIRLLTKCPMDAIVVMPNTARGTNIDLRPTVYSEVQYPRDGSPEVCVVQLVMGDPHTPKGTV